MKSALFLLAIIFLSACVSYQGQQQQSQAQAKDWREVELVNVHNGEKFRLSDFRDKVVIIESMAVWCPLCTEQQRQIRQAEKNFQNVISVSLDVDPNEDAAKLRAHAQRNGFNWRFAVAPKELSSALANNFSSNVLNVVSTPVIILDKNQQPHLLRFGVKPADELSAEIAKYI